jgi:hypothetical protein
VTQRHGGVLLLPRRRDDHVTRGCCIFVQFHRCGCTYVIILYDTDDRVENMYARIKHVLRTSANEMGRFNQRTNLQTIHIVNFLHLVPYKHFLFPLFLITRPPKPKIEIPTKLSKDTSLGIS